MAITAGKPFLEWVLRFLVRQGIRRAILSTGYLGERIEAYFRTNTIEGLEVRCVHESEPLGTAGGFARCIENTRDGPAAWLVLNGDSMIVADWRSFFETLND